MSCNECIILQMWIDAADAIDLFDLAWREIFVLVEAPAARHQTLAAENFVDPRNATPICICRIKQR